MHQLETGTDGAVQRQRVVVRHARLVANPGRRRTQAKHVGPTKRLSAGAGGGHAGHVHEIPVRPAPVRAAAVRVPEQTRTAARQFPVLPVPVRAAHHQAVPGQRHRTVAAARRRRDVRRVCRVRGRHPVHGVQRTLGAHRQAVPAVRRQLRFHRQARVAIPGLGLSAQARRWHGRRKVSQGPRLEHVHAARQVLRVAAPQHHPTAVQHIRAGLQTVQLQFAKYFRLRSGIINARP